MDQTAVSNRNDVAHMRDSVLFDGPDRGRRLSRFWILLSLSSVIAAAGIVADSTATVIGAMIVAPMMMPIQGTMLSTVLGDRGNLVRSTALVIAGATASIAIGFAVGMLAVNDVVAATNSQVAGRVSPGLVDLLAALGTGVVGSIALVRRDIADTLPGVAIAISLVPPLAVAGLTLESEAYAQSLGALLLFVTNVTAILATGIVVMAIYGVHRIPAAPGEPESKPVNRRHAIAVIMAMIVIVGVPLTLSTVDRSSNTLRENTVRSAAEAWSRDVGWDLLNVATVDGEVIVRVTGPLPVPDTKQLEQLLTTAGVDPRQVDVDLVPSYKVKLSGP